MHKSTWQQKATSKAIQKKVERKRNPVSSLVQLAEEFGAPVNGPYSGSGKTASSTFRQHILMTVGPRTYNQIRQAYQVRSYRS